MVELQAMDEARAKLEMQRQAHERAAAEEEERKKAEVELRKRILAEAMVKIEQDRKKQEKLPIKFKDAIGRKFTFPFHLVQTWTGIEELIQQAFLHVEIVGPQVQEGHYDLIGPDGEILLPPVWERLVQPDWSVNMHMWPMDRMPGRPTLPWPTRPMGGLRHGGVPPLGHRGHGFRTNAALLAMSSTKPGGPPLAMPGRPLPVPKPMLGAEIVTVHSRTSSSTDGSDEGDKKRKFRLRRLIPTKISKIKLWKRSSKSGGKDDTDSQSTWSSSSYGDSVP
ncbi:hypothetical protein B0T16DRAFT_419321 [Cercophora newfieldiana]|uniref:Ubiquitin-like domain-containing protein n=1 Tax=Cercophora newfieldiana TaxID=92897 RepID=A0AA39XY38_9PEZI|nr:hypothetical protein B0T16DRAFT_419321 [Cercophora newfieldiana]